MKPAPFQYLVSTTVEEAIGHLAIHGYDAKVLAGGQSLIPTMNFRLAQPAVLVDINPISSLAYITGADNGDLQIGAMTRQRDLEFSALVLEKAPLVRAAMPNIAHAQIRNRGTVGGSLAHADPAAELPAVAVALGANLRIRGQSGDRVVPAADFYQGLFTTDLEPDEILVEVAIPAAPRASGWSIHEMARRHGDFAIVGVVAYASFSKTGWCEDIRLVFFSVGEGPVVAHGAMELLRGESASRDLIEEAAVIASEKDIDPPGDIHATSHFRRHLARVLAERALNDTFRRAGHLVDEDATTK